MMYSKLLLLHPTLGIIRMDIMLSLLDQIMFINILKDHLDLHQLLALQLEPLYNIQD